ncbi:murein biosynthesis integral membrane protein MurJ [Caldanaerobius polysaccharolyticus]|uniref:murein biosynthesis integral membrane protein MurJ n=1 Tax=Caldanaerobius polysaccharolyticus TaxID=44256 RepID=UPI00047CF1B5|nr:murein biosynthesis integral membrane protein MurJ [Caldanaerobius polysaccharolyticus]
MSDAVKVAKAAGVIMILAFLSKILGFGRETVLAAKFGASSASDAYVMATTIPLVVFQLIGSSIGTTFIPVFTEYVTREGREKAYDLTNNIINIILVVSFIVSIGGIVLSPALVKLIAPGYVGERYYLTVALTRIMFPMIVFIGLANVATGVLQAQNRFTMPAFIGIPYNIVIIIALVAFTKDFGIYAVAFATVIATLLQLLVQIPDMYKLGYRYRFVLNFKHPGVFKVLILVLPVLIGSAVNQINVVVDKIFASGLQEGAVASLNYANRLNGFVMGIFGTAISTVIYPTLSKHISLNDYDSYKKSFKKAVNAIFMVMIPITAITMLLRVPIINIVYKRGAFDEKAAYMTGLALLYYAVGMTAFSVRDVINRAFYSLQDTKTPMIYGVYAVLINIVSNLFLVRIMGVGGLALSTSLAAILTSILLFFALRKKLNGIGITDMLVTTGKIFASTALMAVTIYFFNDWLAAKLSFEGVLKWGISFAGSSILGLAVYAFFLVAFRVEEVKLAGDVATRAFSRYRLSKNR